MAVESTRISRSALESANPDGGGLRFDFEGVAGAIDSAEVEAGSRIFGKGLSFCELVRRWRMPWLLMPGLAIEFGDDVWHCLTRPTTHHNSRNNERESRSSPRYGERRSRVSPL